MMNLETVLETPAQQTRVDISTHQKSSVNKSSKWIKFLVGLSVLHGVILCLLHYFMFRALWLDEAFVAVNLTTRSLSGLFRMLQDDQHFPRLYLSLIWLLQHHVVFDLWVLRFLPLAFGVGAILLWSDILWEEFKPYGHALSACAVLLFLTNHFNYYYAGELKQYSSDLFFSGYAFWFAKKFVVPSFSKSYKGWPLICLAWAAPILFSFTYPFVFLALAMAIFLPKFRNPTRFPIARLIPLAVLFVAFFASSYFIDLRYTQQTGINRYWAASYINGHTIGEWLASAWLAATNMIGRWWVKPLAPVLTLIAFFGCFFGFYSPKEKNVSSFMGRAAAGLFLIMFLLAVFKKYPAQYGRMQLFFFPYAVALITYGVAFFKESQIHLIRSGGWALTAGLFALTLFWKTPRISQPFYTHYHWEDITPPMNLIESFSTPRLVIYSQGTRAQLQSYPRLPRNGRFILQDYFLASPHAVFFRKNFFGDGFYYIYAYPNGEDRELIDGLKSFGEDFESKMIIPHFLYLKRINKSLT